jgi:hypothetical protein
MGGKSLAASCVDQTGTRSGALTVGVQAKELIELVWFRRRWRGRLRCILRRAVRVHLVHGRDKRWVHAAKLDEIVVVTRPARHHISCWADMWQHHNQADQTRNDRYKSGDYEYTNWWRLGAEVCGDHSRGDPKNKGQWDETKNRPVDQKQPSSAPTSHGETPTCTPHAQLLYHWGHRVKSRNCEHIRSRSPIRDSFEADLVPSFSYGPSVRTLEESRRLPADLPTLRRGLAG